MRPLVKSFDSLLRDNGYDESYSGDAIVSALENFQKAITNAGILSGTAPAADATALRLENLDATMTSVLFSERHLKIFNSIPRVPSIQMLYQYNKRIRYGGGRSAAGFAEGGSPVGGVSAWERHTDTVRWMGVRGGITHQALTTGVLGGMQISPVEEENRNRTLELLEKVERGCVFGLNSIHANDGTSVNYDGILKQMGALDVGSGSIAPSNVFDMQGSAMSFDSFEEIAERLITTAYISSMDEYITYMSPFVKSDLTRLRLDVGLTPTATVQRHQMGGGRPGGVIDGLPMAGYDTNYGLVNFDTSIFLERVKLGRPLLAANELTELTHADVGPSTAPVPATPSAPTMSASGADATSRLPDATLFYYVVSAFNDSGESLGIVSASAVTAAAGHRVRLTITQVSGATGYRIYRTPGTTGTPVAADINGVNTRWIADVPDSGSGTTVYDDLNQIMPGTGFMIFIRPQAEDIAIPQMSPLVKFPIAIVSTTIEFFLFLYHTLTVKAPQRMFIVKNIGRLSPSTLPS